MTWNDLAGAILASLLNSAVLGAVLSLIAWLVMRVSAPANAATRHALLWILLATIFLIAPVRAFLPVATPDAPPAPLQVSSPGIEGAEMIPVSLDDIPVVAAAPRQDAIPAGSIPVLLLGIAGIAFLIQTARVIASYRYIRRLKKSGSPPPSDLQLNFDEWVIGSGIRRPVTLLLSSGVQSPIATGFRHPAVIIPDKLIGEVSAEDLDHLLLHELAHLARRDDWTNLVARIGWGLVVLHPAAAWVLHRIDEEREIACDDWVVTMTGGARRYALSLSRLAEFRLAQPRAMLATGIGGRRSQFADRIERLLKASRFDSRASVLRIAFVTTILMVCLGGATQAPSWIAFAQDEAPAAPVPPTPAPAPQPDAVPQPAAVPVPPQPPAGKAARAPRSALRPSVSQSPQPPQPPPAPPVASSGKSFLQALSDAGYRDLTVDDIIELRNNGVTAQYLISVNQAGWGKLTTRQIIDLRNHGVSPEYVRGVKEAGVPAATLRDVIDLQNHGVRPDAIRQIHALGFGPYDVKQIITLASHGLRPEFFQALEEAGFSQADLNDIVEASSHGVNAQSLRAAKSYGSQLTLRQIVKLKQAGVI